MSKKKRIVFFALVILLCIIAVFSTRIDKAGQTKTFNTEYTLVLSDYNGKPVHLYGYRLQVLIAYAWASWCPYCGAEIQNLAQLKQKYGDNIQIVAINRGEPLSVARAYTDRLSNTDGVTFLLDPTDAFFKEIGGYAMPEMVFINRLGVIVYHQRGPIQIDDMQAEIEKLLH